MTKQHIDKTKQFLETLEFTPIGKKIGILGTLLKLLKRPSQRVPRLVEPAKFLLTYGPKEREEIAKVIAKYNRKQVNLYRDMIRTFKEWNTEITKSQISKISVPESTKVFFYNGAIFFTFKKMWKWINENTTGKLKCPTTLPTDTQKLAVKSHAFGFMALGVIVSNPKEVEFLKILDHQEVVYESLDKRRGAKPKLKHVSLLMLYLFFKYLENSKVKEVAFRVRSDFLSKGNSVSKMYRNLVKIAPKIERDPLEVIYELATFYR